VTGKANDFERELLERRDEIEVLLEEARKAKAEGRFAPLEPLQEFLCRAHARFSNTN
jgi:lysyl-tRNA synthetase class I